VDHTRYGALRLTDAARPVLKGEEPVSLRRAVATPRTRGRSRKLANALPAAPDAALFDRLKSWRLVEARAQGVPAYVILHDRTLTDIARARPRDAHALAAIGGIGAAKLARYGDALLEIVTGSTA